jgi:hypothetical protein
VNRWLALAVSIVLGGAFAFAAMMVAVAVVYGALWIYVFGDDPWPAWVEPALNIAIVCGGLLLWAIASWRVWGRLRRP